MSSEQILIDAPVTAYSSLKEIDAWIAKLAKLPDAEEVRKAMREANRYREIAASRGE